MTEPGGAPNLSPIVTVRGEAHLVRPPDLATIWVTVRAQGRTADDVRTQLARGLQPVAGVIDALGAAVESRATSGLRVSPVFARRNRLTVTGYEGTAATTVVLADLSVLGSTTEQLLALDDVELGGPSWSLRPDNPVHGEARLAAIAEGRRRASDYAAAFGSTLTGLVEVSDLAEGGGWVAQASAPFARSRAFKGAEADVPELDLQPEEQHVSASVTLRFTISTPVVSAPGPSS